MKKNIVVLLSLLIVVTSDAIGQFNLISNGQGATLNYQGKDPVVNTAIEMLIDDSKGVASKAFQRNSELKYGSVLIGILGENKAFDQLIEKYKVDVKSIRGQWEGFLIQVVAKKSKPVLFVIGSDARGAAYGIMELSRLIGVSPWVWWADATPARKELVSLPKDYKNVQKPSVQFRGIFLNDEDWGLNPWSSQTFEPDSKLVEGLNPAKIKNMHCIGPKTYAKIFELLLRLRANTIWPAMHEVTVPFYFVQGNRKMAEKYGIYIGSSHCEPLARNSATEWDIVGKGPYNYLSNKANILSFWTDRLKELGHSNNIFTLGMRGKHDGGMEGVKSTAEYKEAIDKVIIDQSELIKNYINPDLSSVPQVVIPYKEVLDVYRAGMNVPDYATLMWCDDNYGYITHFPDENEKNRKGGNGIYYHISYWGRPHDYLWLSTSSPALIHQQMKTAYDHGVKKMWIVNVGDIKPAEYQIELFLDMAWNMEKINQEGVQNHLFQWLTREYGMSIAKQLIPAVTEHYRLAYIRKPEFMGNTREEETNGDFRIVKDLPWSEGAIRKRLACYIYLSKKVQEIESQIPTGQQDSFYELVAYPIYGAAEMNKKMLYGQLARHGKESWQASDSAYERILSLTAKYNALNAGKWNRMMDYKPRNLPVFSRVPKVQAKKPLKADQKIQFALNGADFKGYTDLLSGLGYEGKAVSLKKGVQMNYILASHVGDSIQIEVRLLPNHPLEGDNLRFGIKIDDQRMKEESYKTEGRSEEWKENVLRNQAIRRVSFPKSAKKSVTLSIIALDEGVVVDQVIIK